MSVTPLRRVEHSPPHALIDRLIEVTRRDEPLSCCLRVRVNREHVLSAVNFDSPVLVLLLQGHKRIRAPHGWLTVRAGEGFLVPEPMALDIENNPDPVSGWYTAVGIALDESVLGAARQLVKDPITESKRKLTTIALDEHSNDLMAWLDALEREDLIRARYIMAGIVLRLFAQGHRGLLYPSPPLLSVRIRAMVAADPQRDWSSADLESALAVSGATLRRHLAAEGRSLRQVVAEARLSHGLTLLLSTRLPVKAVAARVGYTSASAFIKRFRERYGVEPSRVGG
jgi:AraC-like DNA-binding protein